MTSEEITQIRARVVKWIFALRSGDFVQTAGQLIARDTDCSEEFWAYCCLGVAWACAESVESLQRRYITGLSHSYLPPELIPFYGVRGDKVPFYEQSLIVHRLTPTSSSSLGQSNDDGWTFSEIADFIESNLQDNRSGLFVDGIAMNSPEEIPT